jgi:hypothetical protein
VLNLKKDAKMNIKDCTQTKDGTPVKIYEEYEEKAHGAYLNKEEWLIAVWSADGHNVIPGRLNLDLDLSDWKDDIPWDCLRPEIKIVARDEDGRWFGHLEEPELKMDGQYKIWWSTTMNCPLKAINMPDGPTDWTEAIARRPE